MALLNPSLIPLQPLEEIFSCQVHHDFYWFQQNILQCSQLIFEDSSLPPDAIECSILCHSHILYLVYGVICMYCSLLLLWIHWQFYLCRPLLLSSFPEGIDELKLSLSLSLNSKTHPTQPTHSPTLHLTYLSCPECPFKLLNIINALLNFTEIFRTWNWIKLWAKFCYNSKPNFKAIAWAEIFKSKFWTTFEWNFSKSLDQFWKTFLGII